jgi:hypothetical protein
MQKELHGGVVVGALVLVGLIVAVLAWKFVLAPPAPSGIRHFTPAEFKEMEKQHAQSVQDMQATQMSLYKKAHGGQ